MPVDHVTVLAYILLCDAL